LLGNPDYVVTSGRILFKGEDITAWPTDVRGKAGVFLAFQYPEEIPGVPMIQFLRQALSARKGIDLSVLKLRLTIMEWMKQTGRRPTEVARSWPAAWRSRGTRHGAEHRGGEEGLPHPGAAHPRPPARVPRLGVVVAEADVGARRHADLLRDHPRQRPPRRIRH